MAALALGWWARVVDTLSDETLSLLLGCGDAEGIEAEHADCLIAIGPGAQAPKGNRTSLSVDQASMNTLKATPCLGKANQLSEQYHDWPIIQTVSAASRKKIDSLSSAQTKKLSRPCGLALSPDGDKQAFQIIRQRRSAVSMDGLSSLDQARFYGMLQRLLPGDISSPFSALPWAPHIALFLFIHRVGGLEAGLYVLLRDPTHLDLLKTTINPDFLWEKPVSCPSSLNLYLLTAQDVKQVSKSVSCAQDIAADGVFSLAMLAHFETVMSYN